jgi:capsular exopolysaccharide synthesis family protein
MRTSNIRVVDAATPPGAPYKPDVSRDGLMGLLAGLFLGVAFVVMHERADQSIQEPGDTALYLNVPEMGVISSGAAKGDLLGYYHERKRSPKTPVAIAPGTGGVGRHEGAGPDQMELVTWQRKMSAIAESFRGLLTSILFSGENGSPPRVLVLTSAEPAEGKTTVACNLAIAMAEIKQRVLLIDGDLRKPRIHTIFDLENERGLSTLLEQRPLQEETMAGVVQESRIPGLFVLTSGPTTAAAANLLHSASLVELLGKFRKEFDMILIDTPPMLQIPDARVAGRLADAVILIVRAGRTKRNAAVAARTRFAEDKTRVLGTILNDRDHSPRWYHRYYSRKGYQAGYERHAG